MKVIPKMQSGGGMPPFTYYTPVTVPDTTGAVTSGETTTATSSSSDSTKGQITDKDLMTMLKDIDGLPNDMTDLVSSLSKFYTLSNLFKDGRVNTNQLSNQYLSTLRKVKVANFNKEQFDLAQKTANENGGLSEIAITPTGKLVVQDGEGDLKQITSDEYINNKDKYYALTNSNLLSLRANSPEFAFNNDILNIVENGIGMSAVTSIIDEAISNLGTTSISKEGYSARQENQITRGIEILQEAASKGVNLEGMSLDGLYKTKLLTKDQYQQAQQAVKYIYNMLPSNARTLLEVKSGNTENPRKGSLDLIANLVMSKTNSDIDFQLDYQDDLNPDGSKKQEAKESILNDIELNAPTKLLMGLGAQDIVSVNVGTPYEVQAIGNTLPLTDGEGKNLPTMSTLQDVSKGQFGSILDLSNASMGMHRIDPNMFNKVLIRDGKVSSIDFPSYTDEHGNVLPDLRKDVMDAKLAADRELRAAGINTTDKDSISKNYQQINAVYKKHNLPPAYNPDGTPAEGWSRFAVMNATTTNKVIGDDLFEQNSLLQEETDDNVIDNVWTALKEKDKFDKDDMGWFEFSHDSIYNGTLWVPLDVSYTSALAGQKQKAKEVMALADAEQRWKASQKINREEP